MQQNQPTFAATGTSRDGKCLNGCLVGLGILVVLVVLFFAFGFFLISAETKKAKLVVTPFVQAIEANNYDGAHGMLTGTNFANSAALAEFFAAKQLTSWSGWEFSHDGSEGEATVFELAFHTPANERIPIYVWMVPYGDEVRILTLTDTPPEKPQGGMAITTKTTTSAQITLHPIRRIVITEDLDSLDVNKNEFELGPRTLYAVFIHRGAKPGSTALIKWFVKEEGEMQALADAAVEIEKADHYVVGDINMELPIPANDYKVELYIDGKRRGMKTFSVVIE